jgi:protein SCO1/2
MTARKRRGYAWTLALMLVLILAVMSSQKWIFPKKQPELPVFGEVPPFRLTDQNGGEVSSEDLRGDVWIADFIFTRCQGPCPVMTRTLGDLQGDIPEEVRFVSFSMDPAYDTPEILKAYGDANGADHARWRFLTGDRDVIFSIPKTLKLVADDATEGDIIHSSRYLLIDPEGRVRGWYPVVDPTFETDETELERLKRETEALLKSLE